LNQYSLLAEVLIVEHLRLVVLVTESLYLMAAYFRCRLRVQELRLTVDRLAVVEMVRLLELLV
jgi:hypothetical protein